MMLTYKILIYIFIFIFLVADISESATRDNLYNFITERNVTDEHVINIKNIKSDKIYCFDTVSHLICIKSHIYQQKTKNITLKNSLINILLLQTKNSLYGYCLKKYGDLNLTSNEKGVSAFIEIDEKGDKNFIIQNIEFGSFLDGAKIMTISAISKENLKINTQNIVNSKKFKNLYCAKIFPNAKKLFSLSKYEEALLHLKEIHDLNCSNVEAYILAANSFLKIGNKEDALKIANEVYLLLTDKMTNNLYEMLGDIFLELDKNDEALACYNISLK